MIKRPKDPIDNPLPSGNALAAEALLILHGYTGEAAWRPIGDRGPRRAWLPWSSATRRWSATTSRCSTPSAAARELAVVGTDLDPYAAVYWERFRPQVVFASSPTTDDRIPLLQGRGSETGTLAYLCQGHVCNLPTADPAELRRQMEG